MRSSSVETDQRQGNRTKAVIPVRIKGTDSSGTAFDDLAHTLDVAAAGLRLGSVRRQLGVCDEITVFYRQRKMQYRVVWTRKLEGTSEFQVGLRAEMRDGEAWGLGSSEKVQVYPRAVESRPSGMVCR